MADTLTIHADSNHEYRIRATVAGYEVDLLLDTGFTNDECLMGVSLDEASYRTVESRLHDFADVAVHSVDPEPRVVESGICVVELAGLDDSQVETRILNAGENLLGVCYFHRLTDFTVSWDLAGRTMHIARISAQLRP